MKRIGKRLTAGLAFALAGGFTLGGLSAVTPTASALERDTEGLACLDRGRDGVHPRCHGDAAQLL